MKYQKITLHPFPFHLIVFYGKNKEKSKEWLKEQFGRDDFDEVIGDFKKGKTVQSPDGWIFLWTEDKDISVLAHEAFHVCEYLFERVGVEYNYKSGELWAYMIQYIINQITKGKSSQ